MKVTQATRWMLKRRRMNRDMNARGYELVRGPWELDRGYRTRHRIVDAVIDAGGKDIWVKCEEVGRGWWE
jgi:hypothetical protein